MLIYMIPCKRASATQMARVTIEATHLSMILSMTALPARMIAALMILVAAVGYPKVQNAVTIDSTKSRKGKEVCGADREAKAMSAAILLSVTAILISVILCMRVRGATQIARVTIEATRR